MRREFKLELVLLAVTLAFVNCGTAELTRDRAKALINSHSFCTTPIETIPATFETYQASIADGFRTRKGCGRPGCDLTEEGKKYFKDIWWHARQVTLAKAVTREAIEVTGIAGAGADLREVQFIWRYKDLPEPAARYSTLPTSGAVGVALLKRWDDGWRVASIRQ